MRDYVVLDEVELTLAVDKAGTPLYNTSAIPASGQRRVEHLEWRVDGPDFFSHAKRGEYLGRHYGAGTDGRWQGVDCLGPLINSVPLDTYDVAHSITLLGSSTAVLGSSFILGPGVNAPTESIAVAVAKMNGIWYAYIVRGQIPAKVRLSDMTLVQTGLNLTYDGTDVVATKNEKATSRREVSIAQGDVGAYKVIDEADVSDTGDAWVDNLDAQPAKVFGIAPDRTVLMTDKTVKGNIQSGTVTMKDPSWNTVSTLTNEDIAFTGFVMDGNFWVLGTSKGPYTLDPDTGDFVPLMPEADYSSENGRQMGHWFPIGAIIPLKSGVRYSDALRGESWGVERFLGNSSPVQGYASGGDGSTQWYIQAVYNEQTADTYLVAWRPRQAGDNHPYPLSPHVIARLAGVKSRWIRHLGDLDGARTYPAWIGGHGANAFSFREGRTSRWINDTSGYQYAASGVTYLTEVQLDEIGDIEAFEFHSANAAAGRTIQLAVSVNRAAAVTVGSPVASDGFQRVLAATTGVPQATAHGGYLIRPEIRYATNDPANSPQVLGWLRMRYRPRPKMLKRWKFTFILRDQDEAKTNEDLEEQLMSNWGSDTLLMEDADLDSSYVVVDDVKVANALAGAGSGDTTHKMVRQAEVILTEWQTA